jgi:CelD/BcsL family acetyltransferase involved in cellulose biosynthesis
MSEFVARIITEEAEIEPLRGAWRERRLRHPRPHIGQHPDWLFDEVRAEAARGGRPMVLALYRRGEVVGIAPFLVREQAWTCRLGYRAVARFPITRAIFLGETLMAPDDPAALEAMVRALADAPVPYGLIFLECLPIDSFLWKRLNRSAALGKHFWAYVPDGVTPHRSLDLSGTVEDYFSRFGGRTRRKLQQNVRKLEKAFGGRMEFLRVTERGQVREFLEQVEEVTARSWQGRSMGKGFKADAATVRRFEAQADRGWLRSYLLRNGGRPLAFGIGFQADGVYHYDTIGYDSEWSPYAPGKVLFCLLLEDLFAEDKPDRLDCGYGENDYKVFFANRCEEAANVYLVRKSLYTGCAMITHRLCGSASDLARAALDGLRLRERVRQRLRRDRIGGPPPAGTPGEDRAEGEPSPASEGAEVGV